MKTFLLFFALVVMLAIGCAGRIITKSRPIISDRCRLYVYLTPKYIIFDDGPDGKFNHPRDWFYFVETNQLVHGDGTLSIDVIPFYTRPRTKKEVRLIYQANKLFHMIVNKDNQ